MEAAEDTRLDDGWASEQEAYAARREGRPPHTLPMVDADLAETLDEGPDGRFRMRFSPPGGGHRVGRDGRAAGVARRLERRAAAGAGGRGTTTSATTSARRCAAISASGSPSGRWRAGTSSTGTRSRRPWPRCGRSSCARIDVPPGRDYGQSEDARPAPDPAGGRGPGAPGVGARHRGAAVPGGLPGLLAPVDPRPLAVPAAGVARVRRDRRHRRRRLLGAQARRRGRAPDGVGHRPLRRPEARGQPDDAEHRGRRRHPRPRRARDLLRVGGQLGELAGRRRHASRHRSRARPTAGRASAGWTSAGSASWRRSWSSAWRPARGPASTPSSGTTSTATPTTPGSR